MKVLKIENKKCYFSIDGLNYDSIIDISKDDIYSILDIIYQTNDYTIDEVNDNPEISNEVEKLIYENLLLQFKSFIENKEILHKEIQSEFEDALDKYNIDSKELTIG